MSFAINEIDGLESTAFDSLHEDEEVIPETARDNISTSASFSKASTTTNSAHPEVPSISLLPPRLRFKYEHANSIENSTGVFDRSKAPKATIFGTSSSDDEDILVRESSDADISLIDAKEIPRRSLRYLGINFPNYKETIIDADIELKNNTHSSKTKKKKNIVYSEDEESGTSQSSKHIKHIGKANGSFRRFSARSRPQISYKDTENESFTFDGTEEIAKIDSNSISDESFSSDDDGLYLSSKGSTIPPKKYKSIRRSSIVDDHSDVNSDEITPESEEFDDDDFIDKKKVARSKSKKNPREKYHVYRCLDDLFYSVRSAPVHIDRIMDHIWLPESVTTDIEETILWIDRLHSGEQGMIQRNTPSTYQNAPLKKIVSSKRLLLLVKWKDRSHWWNSWLSYNGIVNKCQSFKKADIYIQRQIIEGVYDTELFQNTDSELVNSTVLDPYDYAIVGRELLVSQWRTWMVPEKILTESIYDPDFVLVKWTNLTYSECTWESLSSNKLSVLSRLLRNLHSEGSIRKKNTRYPEMAISSPLVSNPRSRPVFVRMEEQPDWIGIGSSEEIPLRLRDYQLAGLNWLAYAWHRNINTLLADEMGLGKTIQSVSFISYLFEVMEIDGPFIVIVPLSTIHAWKKAFEQWAPPSLITLLYLGDTSSRKVILDYDFYYHSTIGRKNLNFNVLLTTYELVLKDKTLLGSSIKWALLIVDEAHRLKNANSLLHKTLREDFSFANRLLITGTPLQNSIQELYALLSFLEPSKFKPEDESMLISSVNTEDSSKILEQLHNSLKPHFLRRLKKDVEKSLPMKQERILRVELSPLQKLLYKWILTRNYSELNKNYGSSSITGRASSLLNIVSELRKASSHPYMFVNSSLTEIARDMDPEGIVFHSGKMVLLDALLRRLLSEDHKVLIFSQSVMMLDLLGEFLSLRSIRHCRLDGGTASAERTRQIERFNNPNSGLQVFLLSTRAGGLGINLTAADTVILFDSDWNPQNDLQAMARCHRIGQTKAVSVYRLVSKDTVEEEILERAKKKMVLDHLVIQKMDRSTSSGSKSSISHIPNATSGSELQKILQFGATALFSSTSSTSSNIASTSSLFAQIMITGTFNTTTQAFVDEEVVNNSTEKQHFTTGTNSTTNIPTSLQALFSRPASTALLDLDSILIKAEDNLAKEAAVETDNLEDESFLDSFRVADLSGALAWSEIIPKSELEVNQRIIQEEADRKKAFELQETGKRPSHRSSIGIKHKSPVEEKEKVNESTSSSILSLWNGSIISQSTKDISITVLKANVYPVMKKIIYNLSSFGHQTNLLDDRGNLNDVLGDEKGKIACELLGLSSLKILHTFLIQTLTDNLKQLASDPSKKSHMEDEDNNSANVNSSSGISSSKVFGLMIAPVAFLKRIEGLDHLTRIVSIDCKEFDSNTITFEYCFERINNFFSQKKIKLKNPVSWSIPWFIKDDSALLSGVVLKGYGNWTNVVSIPSSSLFKKVKLITKTSSSFKTPAPTEEHLKRRVDYLLSILLCKDVENSAKKSVIKLPNTETVKEKSTPTKPTGTHQKTLNFRPKSTVKQSSNSDSVSSISSAVIPTDYRKVFKRLFLPVKSYLLMLDDDDENEDEDTLLEKERSILFNVGMHIDSLLLGYNEKTFMDQLGPLSLIPKHELHDLLWSFVYTCWSSSNKRTVRSSISGFSELSQLYRSLAST